MANNDDDTGAGVEGSSVVDARTTTTTTTTETTTETASWTERFRRRRRLVVPALAVFGVGAASVATLLGSTSLSSYGGGGGGDSKDVRRNPYGFASATASSASSPSSSLSLARYVGQAGENENDENGNVEGRELDDQRKPSLVWLFAYPESGGPHVMHVVHTVSGRATAVNEGDSYDMRENGDVGNAPLTRNSLRVYGNAGPALSTGHRLSPPTTKILTLTQTHGTCHGCHPKDYMRNKDEFRKRLWSSSIVENGKIEHVEYDVADVESGLHLYRYPFDNVLLRYWSERERKHVTNHNGWVRRYGAHVEGLRRWCDEMDDHWRETERAWYSADLFALAEDVPCHQEFYKWVAYHDNVDMVERGANLPMRTLRYEELYDHYHLTVRKLLDWLDLPDLRPAPSGGGADLLVGFSQHYFSKDEKERIYAFMKKAATMPAVRAMIETYESNDFSFA